MRLQWFVVDRSGTNGIHAVTSRRSEMRLRADSSLVVEGYPRSANTWLSRGLMVNNPSLQVASHTHGVGLVLRARAAGVPVLLTVRDPDDAIPSCAAYLNISADLAAQRYATFHERLAPLHLPAICFPTLIGDGPTTKGFLESVLGQPVAWPQSADERRLTEAAIDERFGPHPPTPGERITRKAQDYAELSGSVRQRARAAFDAVLSAAPTRACP